MIRLFIFWFKMLTGSIRNLFLSRDLLEVINDQLLSNSLLVNLSNVIC